MENVKKEIVLEVEASFDIQQFILFLSHYKHFGDIQVKSFGVVEKEEQNIQVESQLGSKYLTSLLGEKGILVLKLLSEGLTYKEIAEKSAISLDGVRFYIKKIFKKLNVNNSREAVRIYITTIDTLSSSI